MISTVWTDRRLPSFRGGRGVRAECVQRLIGLPRNPSHQGEPPWPRSHPQLEIPFQAPIASISPAAEISGAYLPNGSRAPTMRSEEHTSELQSLMRISYAVFCLKKKKQTTINK